MAKQIKLVCNDSKAAEYTLNVCFTHCAATSEEINQVNFNLSIIKHLAAIAMSL